MRNDIEYVRGLEARLVELRVAVDLADAEYREEIARLRLTDAEREAIREAVGAYNDKDNHEECAKIAATLQGILKRLG